VRQHGVRVAIGDQLDPMAGVKHNVLREPTTDIVYLVGEGLAAVRVDVTERRTGDDDVADQRGGG
jgi:hypothetical protein